MYSRKPYKRSERMSEVVHNILGEIFLSEIKIEGAGLLTISKVEVTSNLRLAKVFISLLNSSNSPDEIINFLKHKRKLIRYHLGNKLNVKFVPDLKFYYDDSLKKAEKIGQLLNEIRKNEEIDN